MKAGESIEHVTVGYEAGATAEVAQLVAVFVSALSDE
jgi:hypothetical protein